MITVIKLFADQCGHLFTNFRPRVLFTRTFNDPQLGLIKIISITPAVNTTGTFSDCTPEWIRGQKDVCGVN